jgi:hypothetical protein
VCAEGDTGGGGRYEMATEPTPRISRPRQIYTGADTRDFPLMGARGAGLTPARL